MRPKLFTAALVGRPNVGKSSLFNCLLGYRRAIVLDMPGTTLDEIAEKVAWGADPLRLVDSQGIFHEGDDHVLDSLIEQSDVILFVVDAKTGVTPFDRWIANRVRQARRPTLLLVNKSEGGAGNGTLEFSELGLDEVLTVSASHSRNIDSVKEWILTHQEPGTQETDEELTEDSGEETEPEGEENVLTLALIGRPNTGKSTLMNRLCDSQVSRVSSRPLTTRDPISFELETPQGLVKLIDTAGMRRPRSHKEQVEVFSVQAATRVVRNADVVFLCIASFEDISDQDMRLLSLAEREGRPTAVLLNFWDRLGPSERKHFMEDTEFGAYLKKFRVLPMSGLTGLNVERCLPLAFRLFRQSRRRVKTSKLNRMVDAIISKNPPPTAGKQNFNILYASQVRVDPPTFVFFMNRKGNLPASYQRYLENRLKRDLGFQGQTVRVFFRGERG